MRAIVSCPSRNVYQAVFYYVSEGGGTNQQMPQICIPCESYEHAKKVVDAFNSKA